MVKIFSASVNPSYGYDLVKIGKMSYDEAVEFFENDKIGACTCYEHEVDTTKSNEFKFAADENDTMFVWTKVVV